MSAWGRVGVAPVVAAARGCRGQREKRHGGTAGSYSRLPPDAGSEGRPAGLMAPGSGIQTVPAAPPRSRQPARTRWGSPGVTAGQRGSAARSEAAGKRGELGETGKPEPRAVRPASDRKYGMIDVLRVPGGVCGGRGVLWESEGGDSGTSSPGNGPDRSAAGEGKTGPGRTGVGALS